ncbi:hypothetical protein CBER1_01969 [Cercospora berteroae]|uniref:DUF7918 domain-containing protein n=1 Tax=Cercospora berteroae TaxID=357750 RepID=A0A2S6CMT7_9PEZI|nr:hypothetical protein CBER1_01969 [Cercospora berteroae]
MAIHPSFPTMPVTIVVNGRALPEHEDREATPDNEDPEHSTVLRYAEIPNVAAADESLSDSGISHDEADLNFQIHADVHRLQPESYAGFHEPDNERGEYGLAFNISVDGGHVDSLLIFPAMLDTHYGNGKTCISKGQYITADSVRPYRLKTIELIEPEAAAVRGRRTVEEKQKLSQLGTVSVFVYHVRKQGFTVPTVHENAYRDRSIDQLDEKDLKGRSLSHRVDYGEAIPDTGAAAQSDVQFVNLENGPAAVYEFRYGSTDALKKAYVIPRTPSPEPEDPDADLHTMTQEELITELAASRKRDREETGTVARIKQENESPIIRATADTILCIDDDDEGFSEQPLPEPLMKRTKIQGEVTTVDDDEDVEHDIDHQEPPLFEPDSQRSAE